MSCVARTPPAACFAIIRIDGGKITEGIDVSQVGGVVDEGGVGVGELELKTSAETFLHPQLERMIKGVGIPYFHADTGEVRVPAHSPVRKEGAAVELRARFIRILAGVELDGNRQISVVGETAQFSSLRALVGQGEDGVGKNLLLKIQAELHDIGLLDIAHGPGRGGEVGPSVRICT